MPPILLPSERPAAQWRSSVWTPYCFVCRPRCQWRHTYLRSSSCRCTKHEEDFDTAYEALRGRRDDVDWGGIPELQPHWSSVAAFTSVWRELCSHLEPLPRDQVHKAAVHGKASGEEEGLRKYIKYLFPSSQSFIHPKSNRTPCTPYSTSPRLCSPSSAAHTRKKQQHQQQRKQPS